jgi:RNA-directed DNA polymerase
LVETDIAQCFEAIPHSELIKAVEERVCDQSVLKLLRVILRAGVMENGSVRNMDTGTPQGGVISPLLCNVYLHRIDRAWDARRHGELVRYADDVTVMCRSRMQAEAALERVTQLLAGLGLEPKAAKTRIVNLRVGGEGVDFLGFHHRLVLAPGRGGRAPFPFLARWPADKAVRHAKDRIREITDRSRLLLPVDVVVAELNTFLTGWAGYFRFGNSADRFAVIREFARMRMTLFVAKKHKRSRGFGRWVVSYASPNHLGLVGLAGNVVAPRPFRDWRGKPNAAGERRR